MTRAELEDERGFLLRSIEDLDAERGAGDLTDADHRALRDRYTVRAAAVLRSLAELDAGHGLAVPVRVPVRQEIGTAREPDGPDSSDRRHAGGAPRRQRRRRLRLLVWGAAGAFAAAASVLVVAELDSRLPGQTATGSVRLSSAEKLQRMLAQAQILEAASQPARALTLYRRGLRQDPTQEQALAESGWLEFEAGVVAKSAPSLSQGKRDEKAAERAEPGAYAPHLYLGSMLLAEGQASESADEFARFLAGGPPSEVIQRAWPFLTRAYTEAGRTVPARPPAAGG